MPRSKHSTFGISSLDTRAKDKSDECQSKTSDHSTSTKSRSEKKGLKTRRKLLSKHPVEDKTALMVQTSKNAETQSNDEDNKESVVIIAPIKNAENTIDQSLPLNNFITLPGQRESKNSSEKTVIQTNHNVNNQLDEDVLNHFKTEISEKMLELTLKMESQNQKIESTHFGLSNFKLRVKNDFSELKHSIDKSIEKFNQTEKKIQSDFQNLVKDSEEKFHVDMLMLSGKKVDQELQQNIKSEFQTQMQMAEQRFQHKGKLIEKEILEMNKKISTNEKSKEEIQNLRILQEILAEKNNKNDFSSTISTLNNKFDSLAAESQDLKQNYLNLMSTLTEKSFNFNEFFKKVEELIDSTKKKFNEKETKYSEGQHKKDCTIEQLKIELLASEKISGSFQLENSAIRSHSEAQKQLDEAHSERVQLQNKIYIKKELLNKKELSSKKDESPRNDLTFLNEAFEGSEKENELVQKESKENENTTKVEKEAKKNVILPIESRKSSKEKKKANEKESSKNEKIETERKTIKKPSKTKPTVTPDTSNVKSWKKSSEKTNEVRNENNQTIKYEKIVSNEEYTYEKNIETVPDSRARVKSSKQIMKEESVAPSKHKKKRKTKICFSNDSESAGSPSLKKVTAEFFSSESDQFDTSNETECKKEAKMASKVHEISRNEKKVKRQKKKESERNCSSDTN